MWESLEQMILFGWDWTAFGSLESLEWMIVLDSCVSAETSFELWEVGCWDWTAFVSLESLEWTFLLGSFVSTKTSFDFLGIGLPLFLWNVPLVVDVVGNGVGICCFCLLQR